MKINVNIEASLEEIKAILEPDCEKQPVVLTPFFQENWTGKTVRIKSSTPDSEIYSWGNSLKRDMNYGVTSDSFAGIRIQGLFLPKIWFEVVEEGKQHPS